MLNPLAYRRTQNVISILTENNVRANKILKEQSFNMDDIDNNYLFGEKIWGDVGQGYKC